MGALCVRHSKVDQAAPPRPIKKAAVPPSISSVAGVEVSRAHAWYQYALFCVTRLLDKYRLYLFPDVTMGLGSFREDEDDYLQVINEIYNDLCFDERLMRNGRVDSTTDVLTKAAFGQLAFYYWRGGSAGDSHSDSRVNSATHSAHFTLSDDGLVEERALTPDLKVPQQDVVDDVRSIGDEVRDNQAVQQTLQVKRPSRTSMSDADATSNFSCKLGLLSVPGDDQVGVDLRFEFELEERYIRQAALLQADESYRICYEDTLKLVVTDMERKEIWQLSTLYSNKSFQVYLRTKEPAVFGEMQDDSVILKVPRQLRRTTPSIHVSDEEL